jgi:uncharacterized membrane protein YkvA (DUF1232 family)
MKLIARWHQQVDHLKTEVFALYLAYKHPKTPWYAKVCMGIVIGYAVCPIDLIPDFIPVLGYLDDLIIVPAGIYLTLKMIPKDVMLECREKARISQFRTKIKWIITGVIVLIWMVVIFLLVRFVSQYFS